ncbi:aminotransferase class IV [Saccharopolyspora spinosa]|uniref:Branched-subunit amino acid aminotransferase/4-amino-4-deoxychorismate lyase n=1 Tax=Saccharopolyspora spinosa TaxID=60894 RepID=A0A2N3Y670_SACSN|nr:aminotransferase class IV [Saccharopolyspora spinosa]PKW18426.1 branched-subunit amino acid aminotransferase/4-amino-4-deoxychorismate lyase [Saccharopolyspora spinosa]
MWHNGALHEESAEPNRPLWVVDSWLLDEGEVRGLALHRDRFVNGCREADKKAPDEVLGFWLEMCRALPRTGRWFPRAELSGHPKKLRAVIRPCPDTGGEVVLWPCLDPRNSPRRKGPDVPALANARQNALVRGAHDAVLLTKSGALLEAAHGALLWWSGERICMPVHDDLLLPSVTLRLIRQLASRDGVPIARVDAQLQDLANCEVWYANALHGIRLVRSWLGSPVRLGESVRAARWQDALTELREPLP